MIDVFISDGVLHLVLEFCPYDMEKVIRDKSILLHSHHVKSYMQMLLRGIDCCHKHFVLHRGKIITGYTALFFTQNRLINMFIITCRFKACQSSICEGRSDETGGFWFGARPLLP